MTRGGVEALPPPSCSFSWAISLIKLVLKQPQAFISFTPLVSAREEKRINRESIAISVKLQRHDRENFGIEKV